MNVMRLIRNPWLEPNLWLGRCFLMLVLVVQSVSIAAAEQARTKVRIALAGDSTVTDASGWGPGFAARLGPDAEYLNLARSGRSSRSFVNEGHWKKVLEAKPDFILIQFGHNDQPGKGPDRETDPATTYREFLARYVDEARAINARPILMTSLARRHFTAEGKIRSDLGPYAEAVKAVAAEKQVPVIDLHALSIELLERLGPQASAEFDPKPREDAKTAAPDKTHLSPKGSAAFGTLVAEALKKAEPALVPYLKAS
jgi:lysophospholipase L1-like esterase